MPSPNDSLSLPYVDFIVYGRRSRTHHFTLTQKKEQLWRTVHKVPEVMVKVSGGGKTAQHVQAHLNYITRHGLLTALTDKNELIQGTQDVKDFMESWDIDLGRGQGKYRQAFNIVLSMPKDTDPQKLLSAAQHFAQETFFGEQEYLMVLHTQTTDPHPEAPEHPHVHLVVKAENVAGKRLCIQKADLEDWRQRFAESLRQQGIEANATPRELRGQIRKPKSLSLLNLEQRGQSFVLHHKQQEARQALLDEPERTYPWESLIIQKRNQVVKAFFGASTEMHGIGDEPLACALEQFAKALPPIETERDQMKRSLTLDSKPMKPQLRLRKPIIS